MHATNISTHALDDVVWNTLRTRQRHFALGDERALRYPSAVTAFGALADRSAASYDALRALIEAEGPVALVAAGEIVPPAGFSVVRRGTLVQMVRAGSDDGDGHELPHVTLGTEDVPEMLALTAATQPGPFGSRTVELGGYIGIRDEGRLVAMAGERMKLDGFTEISAVCVDESARGRGYAAGLMKQVIAKIRARGETPFLHVFTSNHAAITLYHALGFVERRALHLTVLGGE